MNPLRRLFADRPRRAKARNRRSRLGLESLEGRLVLSAAQPVMPLQPHAVGSTAPAEVSTVQHSATLTANTAPSAPQTGTAFGLGWRSYYDNQTAQYNLDIQDHAGFGFVFVENIGGRVVFLNGLNGFQAVNGPTLTGNHGISARVFANNMGNGSSGDLSVNELGRQFTSWSVVRRTTTGTVNTPTGSIGLTYDYNCINNSGTLTIADINGKGTFTYEPVKINWSQGDPPVDSPSGNANTVQTIDFQMVGTESDAYTGGIDVFHSGLANATITYNVTYPSTGTHYTIQCATGT
jgi:hypothetical protein